MIRQTLGACAMAFLPALTGCGSTTPSCAYSLQTPSSFTFSAAGGSGTITVNTPSSCRWYAEGNAFAEDWVRVPSPVQSGTASVTFTVAPAAQLPQLPLPRSGAIDVFKEGTNERLFRVVVEQR
jgi:hypothetical protein